MNAVVADDGAGIGKSLLRGGKIHAMAGNVCLLFGRIPFKAHSDWSMAMLNGNIIYHVVAGHCPDGIVTTAEPGHESPMPPHIRPALASDVPVVLELIRGLAEYERLLAEFEATKERLETQLFPAHGKPAAECVLAFEDGAVAGFALFFANFSTFLAKPGLYLEDLFVKPELRGRGIGKALLLHVARLAAQRGCGRMEWTVLDWNEPAIKFYDSIGARKLPDWRICRLAGDALARHA